jgi:hypothetical protein
VLIEGIADNLRPLSWDERDAARDAKYDLVINLEDEEPMSAFVRELEPRRIFGAFLDSQNVLRYSDDSRRWFDLSLISVHGRDEADRLKLQNRRTYQELIFDGLGLAFSGEEYFLPPAEDTGLRGDIAIAPEAGAVWPMKRWAYYDQLRERLEAAGFTVNVLGTRPTLLEHLADVRGHRLLVSGDTLPMHLALGSGVRCVSLFTCTSPWEIFDYSIQTKIVSPLIEEFFYKRGFDPRATTAISLEEVFAAAIRQMALAGPALGTDTRTRVPRSVSPLGNALSTSIERT